MNTVLKDLCAEKAKLKLSWQDIAGGVHKDASTVQKQLSSNGSNLTLALLDEYAVYFNGEIVFLPNDVLNNIKNSENISLRFRLAEAGTEIEKLKNKLEIKDELIQDMRARLAKLEEQLTKNNELLSHKDARIDSLTDKLLSK